MSDVAQPVDHVTLDFSGGALDAVPRDISACVLTGDTLWVACDESAEVIALERAGADRFGSPRVFPLTNYFGRFAQPPRKKSRSLKARGEMDIEGLAAEGGYLWIVGSHTRTRARPKGDAAEALDRLAKVRRPANRFFLGRLPLHEDRPGRFSAVAERTGRAPCGTLSFHRERSRLETWLAGDPHLAPFVDLPSKENGLDVEGLAVSGARVFLGLRGPVVRGCAVVLELRLEAKASGALKARRFEDRRRYRKSFVDLDGLGIRSLSVDGHDLVILAGPTLPVSGPSRIYRWRGALKGDGDTVAERSDVGCLVALPTGRGMDHPEAVEILPGADSGRRFLVVHDAPAGGRVDDTLKTVKADLFDVP